VIESSVFASGAERHHANQRFVVVLCDKHVDPQDKQQAEEKRGKS
jgi:hypothetical protein